jgi:hypothetical protein
MNPPKKPVAEPKMDILDVLNVNFSILSSGVTAFKTSG